MDETCSVGPSVSFGRHRHQTVNSRKTVPETEFNVEGCTYDSPVVGTAVNNDSGYFTPSPAVQEQHRAIKLLIQVPSSTPTKPTDAPQAIIAPSSLFPTRTQKSSSRLSRDDPLKSSSTTRVSSNHARFVSPHLIGHFVGRRRVDFMRELRTLNLGHVASDMVRSLSPLELDVACQVSRTWREMCLAHPRDRKRLRIYQAQRQYEKENGGTTKLRAFERDHGPLLLLGDRHNWLVNVAEEPPSVPKEMARFMRFTEEAKNLDVDQLLDKCPRCSSPARVDPLRESAECRSTNGCGLVYCLRCRCERGHSHVCDSPPLLSPPRQSRNDSATQKSRQDRKAIARKNLRRLLS